MISVIIPALNAAPFIAECLRSAILQDYPGNYEIIVIDQDKTGETRQALHPFLQRIVYLFSAHANSAAARNLGIEHAAGDLIANLDADDVWESNALSSMAAKLEPDIDVVFPNARLFGNAAVEGKLFRDSYPARRPVTFEDVASRTTFVAGGALYRRQVCERVGCYDPSLSCGIDFDLWLRMLKAGAVFDFIDAPVYRYRVHSGQITAQPSIQRFDQVAAIYQKHLRLSGPVTLAQEQALRFGLEKILAAKALEQAKIAIGSGDHDTARAALALANRHYNRTKLRIIGLGLAIAPSALTWLYRVMRGSPETPVPASARGAVRLGDG